MRELFDDPRGKTYEYRDAGGLTTIRTVTRTPEKRFRQAGQTRGASPLYRLPEVAQAVAEGRVVHLTEGEQDADTAFVMGGTGTTAPQGATNFHLADVEPLRGGHVVAVVDRDAAGEKWAGIVAEKLAGIVASLAFVEAAHGKDLSDHYAAGGTLGTLAARQAPQEAQEAPQEAPGSTWAPVDLDGILDALQAGTLERPRPTVGSLDGGSALFYAGRVNGLAGESGGGKTWAALAAVAQELEAGNGVAFVDLEDDAAGILSRLLDLGTDPEAIRARFAYVHPDQRLTEADREHMGMLLDSLRPSLVVIDSTGEGLALEGANPNADEEVARWFRILPRWVADQGPAVVILDHVTKADSEGLWPIGSQRKRAAISGAQYMLRVVKPFDRTTAGYARLVAAKDRSGNYRAGQHVADLRVSPGPDGVEVALVAAIERDPAEPFRPTTLMERVSKALEDAEAPLSYRSIEGAVTGRKGAARAALDVLVAEGFVSVEDGARNAKMHTLTRAYRQADDPQSDTYTGGGHSTEKVPPIECLTVPRPRDGDGGRTVKASPGDSRGTVGDGGTVTPIPSRSPACPECAEPLDGPGYTSRCRPNHTGGSRP
ncbi:AAA family ATPase [Serinibacter salmoneus]|nr:AAA family ATPase [Serinibacter salmoneus]